MKKLKKIMKNLFIFLVFIGVFYFINIWIYPQPAVYSQPINADTITIEKPGIVKFDWTTGNLDYKGVNANADAADGDLDWLIYKYTWSSGNPTVIQKKMGSWTSRASYF